MTQMTVRKRLAGEVQHNDGEFVEVQTIGVEGLDENLLLEEVQFHRRETTDSPEEFKDRFPVGARLNIVTTTEITVHEFGRAAEVNRSQPEHS